MTTLNRFDINQDVFYYSQEVTRTDGSIVLKASAISANEDDFTEFWLEWLKRGESFLVRGTVGLREFTYTVRCKRLPARVGQYWYSQTRIRGKTRQKYIGRPDRIGLWELEQHLVYYADLSR